MTTLLWHLFYGLLAFDVVVLVAAVGSAMWTNHRNNRREEALEARYDSERRAIEREAA